VPIDFEPSYLGAHSHELRRGPRVRLRLVQIRDQRVIRSFLSDQAHPSPDLAAARLVAGDPRERVAICAMAFVGGTEMVIGVGSIEVGAEDPDLLVVDAELTEGLDELLTLALQRRADIIRARRAA
jgi:hypothetical protein